MASSGIKVTLTSNGTAGPVQCHGPVHISLSGNFGGGTAVVQTRDPEDSVFTPVVGGSFNAPADQLFDFPPGSRTEIQAVLTGSAAPVLKVIFKR